MIYFSSQSLVARIDEPTLTHHIHPKFIWGFTLVVYAPWAFCFFFGCALFLKSLLNLSQCCLWFFGHEAYGILAPPSEKSLFCGFWETYNNGHPPLWYYTEQFHISYHPCLVYVFIPLSLLTPGNHWFFLLSSWFCLFQSIIKLESNSI